MAHLPKGQGVFLPPFKAWLASNIPAVYDNTMTYYEELCALIKYLQDIVIPALNHNAEAVTAIATAVEQLQKYVEDYFKNLDVQEEINNKLDQMAEDGTLQEIVASYLNSAAIWGFDTVADMQAATNLINGSYARTLGFNTINDGGGALYYITDTGSADGKGCIAVGNLYANIVIPADNKLSIKQIGATNSSDIHDYVIYLINKNITCYIPKGVWKTTPIQISKFNTSRIIGEPVYLGNDNEEGTILTPVADQAYIIRFGYDVATSLCNNATLKNIQFQTGDYTVVNALQIFRNEFSTYDNISFNGCKCSDSALSIIEMWESELGRLYFRSIDAPYALRFGNKVGSGNITANYFKYLSFEGCRYGCISFGTNTGYSCNTIDVLDYESGAKTFDDEVRSQLTNETVYTPYSIIELGNGYNDIVINTINVNNIANFAYTSTNGDYVRCTDRIINSTADDTGYACVIINNISGSGAFKQPILINANIMDKFICNNVAFRTFQYFTTNVGKCRIFKDTLNNDFINNYIDANKDRSYRDLSVSDNIPSCSGTSRAVRVATIKKTGNTIYIHAKGTGQIYYGTEHIGASDADNYVWYNIDITALSNGSYNNLQIATNASVTIDDYYIA